MNDICFDAEVEFIYSDKVPKWKKGELEAAFMLARRYAIELINPNFVRWNAEYGQKINGIDDMAYKAYIQNKENEVLRTFNYMWGGPVELFADEYADIAGRFILKTFRGDKIITMHMILKPRPKERIYDLLSKR